MGIMTTRCRCSSSSLRLGVLRFNKPFEMFQLKININDLNFEMRASSSNHSSVEKLEAHVVLISSDALEGMTLSHKVKLKS